MIWRCIRACFIRCSFKAFWTSAGISGEVWLIFIAASCTFTECLPFCLISFFSLVSTISGGALGMQGGAACTVQVSGLLRQHGQHSFQKTKRETTNSANPQKLTTTARRLTDISVKREMFFKMLLSPWKFHCTWCCYIGCYIGSLLRVALSHLRGAGYLSD